jgi:hypothetical protein
MTEEARAKMLDRAYLEKLLVDCGHAINANNGRCALIEDVLCRMTSVICALLPPERKAVIETAQERDPFLPHGWSLPEIIGLEEA